MLWPGKQRTAPCSYRNRNVCEPLWHPSASLRAAQGAYLHPVSWWKLPSSVSASLSTCLLWIFYVSFSSSGLQPWIVLITRVRLMGMPRGVGSRGAVVQPASSSWRLQPSISICCEHLRRDSWVGEHQPVPKAAQISVWQPSLHAQHQCNKGISSR